MEKVVNIIGLGLGAIDAPWTNETDEFWGINNAYIYGKLTRIFMMHGPEQTIKSSGQTGREAIPLTKAFKLYPDMRAISLDKIIFSHKGGSIYGFSPIEKLEDLKKEKDRSIIFTTEAFPLMDATKLIGTSDFSCSATYLISMAILEGFDRIRLYGFEVWSGINDEYKEEAPGIERWLNLARGKGIKTDISFQVVPTIRDKYSLYGYTN